MRILLCPQKAAWCRVSLAERVLAYLAQTELQEIDPWLRDDIRIAWLTVLYASQGQSQPFVAAHCQVLGIHPDHLQTAIEARRRALLGTLYDQVMQDTSLPPKKPSTSVTEIPAKKRA